MRKMCYARRDDFPSSLFPQLNFLFLLPLGNLKPRPEGLGNDSFLLVSRYIFGSFKVALEWLTKS